MSETEVKKYQTIKTINILEDMLKPQQQHNGSIERFLLTRLSKQLITKLKKQVFKLY